MSATNTVSNDIGTKLLFENDRVRVWDLRLAPAKAPAGTVTPTIIFTL